MSHDPASIGSDPAPRCRGSIRAVAVARTRSLDGRATAPTYHSRTLGLDRRTSCARIRPGSPETSYGSPTRAPAVLAPGPGSPSARAKRSGCRSNGRPSPAVIDRTERPVVPVDPVDRRRQLEVRHLPRKREKVGRPIVAEKLASETADRPEVVDDALVDPLADQVARRREQVARSLVGQLEVRRFADPVQDLDAEHPTDDPIAQRRPGAVSALTRSSSVRRFRTWRSGSIRSAVRCPPSSRRLKK